MSPTRPALLPALLLGLLLAAPAAGAEELLTVADPPGGTFSKVTTVTLRSPAGATVYYTIDGSEPNTESSIYRSPLQLRTDTVLLFFALDTEGRREPVRRESYVFSLSEHLLDTTAPEVTADRPSGRYGAGENVRLSASEEAVIHYTTDGSEPTASSPVFSQPLELTGGKVRLRFFAVDTAGNRSSLKETEYTVDSTFSETKAYPPGGLFRPPLGVRLSTAKEGAVIRYTTDGSAPSAKSPAYSDPIVLSQQTVLRFFSVDDVGNVEPTRQETYTFDTAVPVTVASPPPGAYPPPLTVTLTGKKGARIHYTLDGTAPDNGSTFYTAPIPVNGPLTIRFFGLDMVGNQEEVRTASYSLRNGVWKTTPRGVFVVPSVTSGNTIWMGAGEGLTQYTVRSGTRQALGTGEGLPGGKVNDLLLDEKGILWVASAEGLAWQSGDGFLSLTRDEGLPAREVTSLGLDPDGSVWACTPRGAARVKGGRVVEVVTAGGKGGLPSEEVLCAAVDPAGTRWFGTSRGLARSEGKGWKTFTRADGLPEDRVSVVEIDREWGVWAGGRFGLARYDGSSWKVFTQKEGVPPGAALVIAPDPDGVVWVATEGGVARYSGGKWIREEGP